MKEAILHYAWQFKLYNKNELKTTENKAVEIVYCGLPNNDAGADFFNAKIKIDGQFWVGNIEIHDKSSDWQKHMHHKDKSYDNVILHVVRKVDQEIRRTNGEVIPQLELKILPKVETNYEDLIASKKWIACEKKITNINPFVIHSLTERMLVERLEYKTKNIEKLLQQSENNWETSFYISLARSFGFGINSDTFEQLARSTPLLVLAKHKNDIFQIEALLFGQAGMLTSESVDDYHDSLKKEYDFLQKKYQLKGFEQSQWKFLRIRPDNFPSIRIAQFAQLIHKSSKLFSKIIEINDIKKLRELFQISVSEYWKTHYQFGKESKQSPKSLGKNSIDIILINTIVPYIFLYHKKRNNINEIAITFLQNISAESNSIIKKWEKLGVKAKTAAETQALLHLYKFYCQEKKCIRCNIGHQVLTTKTKR